MNSQITSSQERPARTSSGILMLLLSLAITIGGVLLIINTVAGVVGPDAAIIGGIVGGGDGLMVRG